MIVRVLPGKFSQSTEAQVPVRTYHLFLVYVAIITEQLPFNKKAKIYKSLHRKWIEPRFFSRSDKVLKLLKIKESVRV